jgi:hypothetical protein
MGLSPIGGNSTPTGTRDALQTLIGADRLDATAIKNIPIGTPLISKGAYSGSTTYNQYDTINSAGSSYWWANVTPGNNAPPSADWQLIANIGIPGTNGTPGINGTGDMNKSTYDTNNDGIVDDAARLGANLPAYYLNRTNHTGNQLASTVSDFAEAVDDRVGALLVPGSNITLTYNDPSNTLTIASTGSGGGGLTPWQLKSSDYTAIGGDRLRVDATAGDLVITLPAAPTTSTSDISIQRLDASTNKVLLRTTPNKINNQSGKDGVFSPVVPQLIESVSYANSTIGWLGQFDRLTYQNIPVTGGSDPFYSNVALLLRASSSGIADLKGNTINQIPTVGTSTTVTKFGYSIYLAGGHLSIPQVPSFDLASQDFTLEYWFRNQTVSTFSGLFLLDGTDFPFGIYLSASLGSNFSIYAGSNTAWALTGLDGGLPSATQFDHFALSRNSSNWNTYKNGVLVSSATYAGSVGTPTSPIRIGNNGGSNPLNCYIEELRLTVGVGRYPSAFTPPTSQFPNS